MEIDYVFGIDPLEQRNVMFSLDGNQVTIIAVAGTSGKVASIRVKTYLKQNSVLYFEQAEVVAVKIYELN